MTRPKSVDIKGLMIISLYLSIHACVSNPHACVSKYVFKGVGMCMLNHCLDSGVG